jgi:hypothetical protein
VIFRRTRSLWEFQHTSSVSDDSRERQVLGDNMAAEQSRLGGKRDLVQAAHWLPGHRPSRAHETVRDWRAGPHGDTAETCCSGKLLDASGGKRRLVREVPVPDVTAERTDGIRHPGNEDPTWFQAPGDVVEGLEHLLFGQMLEEICRGDCRELASAPDQHLAVVTTAHLIEP